MAEMEDMLKKLERVSGRHSRIKEKIEALKQQLIEEEKSMQREKDKVNGKWMKKFAALAENKGLQVYDLDPVKIIELVVAAPEDFYVFGKGCGCNGQGAESKENMTDSKVVTEVNKVTGLQKEEP